MDSGHGIPLEKPEAVVQAIRGALKGGYLDILITDLDTAQALNQ